MNTTYSTFRFFTSPEKEETWLEQMAAQGWLFQKVTSYNYYTFQQAAPETRRYKIDYRDFRNQADERDYLVLFDDSGWQPVMQRPVNYAYYFTSSQPDARRDIFSDTASRAQRNLRYAVLMAYATFPAFLPLLVLYLTGSIKVGSVGYQTPGLWQMTGSEFIFHFLFETPFVILRAGGYVLPLIPILLGLFFILRYYWIYQVNLRQQAR